MTANEKFDKITALIEQEIKNHNISTAEMAISVARKMGMSTRDLSIILMFLTGQTLSNYIKERRMMSAYEYICNCDKYNANTAVAISGLGDQPTFNKKFKKQFGFTPGEGFTRKDKAVLKLRLFWNTLCEVEVTLDKGGDNDKLSRQTVYGISYNKFEEVAKILKLQKKYKFDQLQCDIAYYIYKTYEIPLELTFMYVNEFAYKEPTKQDIIEEERELREFFNLPPDYQFAEEDEDIPRLSREEYMQIFAKENADDPEIRYVYFNAEVVPIYETYAVIEKMHREGITDVTKIDPRVINICASGEINTNYCIRAVDYFDTHATEMQGEDTFDEYIENIFRNKPIETAFKDIIMLDDFDY